MRWGYYPGISRWTPNVISSVLNVTSEKEAEGNLIQTEEKTNTEEKAMRR